MTPEEHEKMNELCQRIQVEKNQDTLNQLCRELNDLLELTRNAATQSSRVA